MVRSKDIYIFVKSYYNENLKIFNFQFILSFVDFLKIPGEIYVVFHQKFFGPFWTNFFNLIHGPLKLAWKTALLYSRCKMVSNILVAIRKQKL